MAATTGLYDEKNNKKIIIGIIQTFKFINVAITLENSLKCDRPFIKIGCFNSIELCIKSYISGIVVLTIKIMPANA